MDGFSWRQWRRNAPVPSTDIPYGPYSVALDNGLVYSLDKFRPRFWFPLAVRRSDPNEERASFGLLSSITEQDRIDAAYEVIRRTIVEYHAHGGETGVIRGGVASVRGNVAWWSLAGTVFTLQKYKPFGRDDFEYNLLLEFNPNKSDSAFVACFVGVLQSIDFSHYAHGYGLGDYRWSNTRIDYALDIPFPISDVKLLTRKVGSSFMGTTYFGTRGQSGYTRVYDKRQEILDKQRKDIGREVTRIEWENHHSLPMYMDFPFILGDLGRYEVLRYVAMSDWPKALRTFDPHTASKIRKSCLTPVDVDPSIFDALHARLLCDLGLDMDHCLDRDAIKASALASQEAEDLERIQSWLAKHSGVEL